MDFAGIWCGSNFSAEFQLQGHFRLQAPEDRISASAPNFSVRDILGFRPRRTGISASNFGFSRFSTSKGPRRISASNFGFEFRLQGGDEKGTHFLGTLIRRIHSILFQGSRNYIGFILDYFYYGIDLIMDLDNIIKHWMKLICRYIDFDHSLYNSQFFLLSAWNC